MGDSGEYQGPERRVRQRRQLPDRRAMVRFEPDKVPRRSGQDRRRSGGAEDIWNRRENF